MTDTITCLGTDMNNNHHLVSATRRRDEFGIIIGHRTSGTTVCGKFVKALLPFLLVKEQATRKNCCPECLDVYYDSKLSKGTDYALSERA